MPSGEQPHNQHRNAFVAFLAGYLSLSGSDASLIASLTETRTFSKGQFLLRRGEVCNSMYLVVSGAARVSVETPGRKEFTLGFYFNGPDARLFNRFAGDYASFVQQSPSGMFCEALSDLETVRVSRETLQTLYATDPKFIEAGRQIAEEVFAITMNRLISQKVLTAEERYRHLLQYEPGLLVRFPHYYIATYLGITPQSLSRLRAKVTP